MRASREPACRSGPPSHSYHGECMGALPGQTRSPGVAGGGTGTGSPAADMGTAPPVTLPDPAAPDPVVPVVPDPQVAAFFDVDNTLMRGASIYHFARGLAARKLFGPRDLIKMAIGQVLFRI